MDSFFKHSGSSKFPTSKRMLVILTTSSGIEFSALNSCDITRMSSMKMATKQLYEEGGVPSKFGPLDNRLGISEKNKVCETCSHKISDCPGHFGYLKF